MILPSASFLGASPLKQPHAIGAQPATGSNPLHHQPPAAATGSRSLIRRATGPVAYWLASPGIAPSRLPIRASSTSLPARVWTLAATSAGCTPDPSTHSCRCLGSVPSGLDPTSQPLPAGGVQLVLPVLLVIVMAVPPGQSAAMCPRLQVGFCRSIPPLPGRWHASSRCGWPACAGVKAPDCGTWEPALIAVWPLAFEKPGL